MEIACWLFKNLNNQGKRKLSQKCSNDADLLRKIRGVHTGAPLRDLFLQQLSIMLIINQCVVLLPVGKRHID